MWIWSKTNKTTSSVVTWTGTMSWWSFARPYNCTCVVAGESLKCLELATAVLLFEFWSLMTPPPSWPTTSLLLLIQRNPKQLTLSWLNTAEKGSKLISELSLCSRVHNEILVKIKMKPESTGGWIKFAFSAWQSSHNKIFHSHACCSPHQIRYLKIYYLKIL